MGDKDTGNALGRFVSRGRWRKGSWVLAGRCGPDCRLTRRASAGARPPVCRHGPLHLAVDPSSAPLPPAPAGGPRDRGPLRLCPPPAALQPREEGAPAAPSLSLFLSISLSLCPLSLLRARTTGSSSVAHGCETKPLTPTKRGGFCFFLLFLSFFLLLSFFFSF